MKLEGDGVRSISGNNQKRNGGEYNKNILYTCIKL